MADIKFGTSGWRAIISEDFTFSNVRLVIQAIADYIRNQKSENRKQLAKNGSAYGGKAESSLPKAGLPMAKRHKVVVGYDTRFLSKEFADEAAKVLSCNGILTLLCNRDVPTPVIAHSIIKNGCDGGINFTASHNPPEYNGIKFSSDTGGPARPKVTRAIENGIARLKRRKERISYQPNKNLIKNFDPRASYLKQIEKIVDFKAIKKAKLKIGIDCLYGTSRGYLDLLLRKQSRELYILHDYLNPYFNGKRPEPAPENIRELISLVKNKNLDLGLATDGDADRFGIIDSDGTYITPNQVITLLLYHLINTRKRLSGMVARTVATTHAIDALASKHGIRVTETPVGFKYFVDIINSGNCIIAGEESGGLSMSGHVPEKDGILACLLIAEMVAIERKPIKDILNGIYSRYGRLYSDRIDISLPEEKKRRLVNRLKSQNMKKFAGLDLVSSNLRDGCKLYLKGGSWILFRPSGTEPIIRIYFESRSKKILKDIKRAALGIVK